MWDLINGSPAKVELNSRGQSGFPYLAGFAALADVLELFACREKRERAAQAFAVEARQQAAGDVGGVVGTHDRDAVSFAGDGDFAAAAEIVPGGFDVDVGQRGFEDASLLGGEGDLADCVFGQAWRTAGIALIEAVRET